MTAEMNTDSAWEAWGQRDPYYGVITDSKFRKSSLTAEAKKEFFGSGQEHAEYVMTMIRNYIDPNFKPKSILDFGCGVGRLVVPFAKEAELVTGMDVSNSMLLEARKNCNEYKVGNAKFLISDDELSLLDCQYDLIHSFIVFQHIPRERGRSLVAKLLEHIALGGVGAIHFSYSKSHFADTYGLPPVMAESASPNAPELSYAESNHADADPEMQMNPYNLNELFFLMQTANVSRFHAEFTNHGGELGIFLFFKK